MLEADGIVPVPQPFLEKESRIPIPYSLLDSIPICVLGIDHDYRILHFNQVSYTLFQNPPKLLGHPIWKLCFRETDIGIFKQFLTSGSEHSLNLTLKGHNREPVHTKIYSTLLENDIRLLFMEDNTTTFLLEEELHNFRTAVHFAADAIYLFDERGMIFFTNPAFEQQLGLKTEEIIGKDVKEFWSTRVPPVVYTDLWTHVHEGKTWSGEIKCLRSCKEEFDVEVRVRPIYTESKMFVAYVCVQRDIADRKHLETKLAEYSHNLHRMVTERTAALAKLHEISQLFHSTETLDKRLRLVLIAVTAGEAFGFNRAFLLLYNPSTDWLEGRIAIGPSTPEEAGRVWSNVAKLPDDGTFMGRLGTYLDHTESKDEHANYIVRQLATPLVNTSSILVQAITLDRSFIVVEGKAEIEFDASILGHLGTNAFAVIPLMARYQKIGVLVVDNVITKHPISPEDIQMVDILANQAALAIAHAHTLDELARKIKETEFAYSELRRSQEKLIESSKFAALGQMAATVAHEIRTPLVAIGGFANILKNKFSDEAQDKDYHYIQIISEESMRLEDVLNRLLFYARPSTPNCIPQDFNAFIESILLFMHKEIETNHIRIEPHFDPTLPPIPFDRNLFRQVIINIIQNGIQSMENGGTLCISTCIEDNKWAALSLQDTGAGISKEHLSRIFEPFFSTKHAGTGLGLHVSQRIVASHNGKFEIASHVGKGTTVTIRLPIRTGETP